ncbi:hypothetical protein ACEPAG_2777 [Sanghuangporus baumii]
MVTGVKLAPCLALLSGIVTTASFGGTIDMLGSSVLGQDPQTVNRLNGGSFQQDPLVTFNGYQYATFYDANSSSNASVRYVSVARRELSPTSISNSSTWEKFALTDYNQTLDDGHDIISLGISHTDGTLHLGFDQHDDDLHYRVSKPGVATNPQNVAWSADLFGEVLDYLPGLEHLDKSIYFTNITYPRFLSLPASAKAISGSKADLLLELRVGRSGLGDDWLYAYEPNEGWMQIGKYLEVRPSHSASFMNILQREIRYTREIQGVNNNAYINGLDFDSRGALHVSWTYRDYVNDTGQDVAVQAGPNGPENNHDMDYAISYDLGRTWRNNWNQTIANLSEQSPIDPTAAGITIFSIPKYGGILNQEAQTIDQEGRLHVLNRENTTGVERWYHYWRSTAAHWTRTPLPLPSELIPASANNVTGTPTVIGKRGKLFSRGSSLFALLPSNAANSSALSILGSTAQGHFRDWTVVWEVGSGCDAEPLFDRYRLESEDAGGDGDGVLSLFLVNGTNLEVLDLDLSEV